MLNRAETQEKIDEIRKGKDIPLSELKPLMLKWFKTKELVMDNLTQEFMEQHLAEDLINYEGVI